MPNLCEKYKFTILPRHYHNIQAFTQMPRHLRKCRNYDITANIYRSYSDVRPVTVIVYHSDVMWPVYTWSQRSVLRARVVNRIPRKLLAATTSIKLPWCAESTMPRSTPPGCTRQVAWSVKVPYPIVMLHSLKYLGVLNGLKDTHPLRIWFTRDSGHFVRPPF
jgi:hypothetical protein